LAILSQKSSHDAEAISQYQQVLDVDTNSIFAMNNLAMLLASDPDPRLRDGNRAVRLAEQACELTGNQQAIPLYTLAAAYAEAGQFSQAIAAGEKARQIALAQGQTDIAKANDPLLELYKAGHPFHQQPAPATSQ
jgi:tetratricopeptide (TPR) repeat protein